MCDRITVDHFLSRLRRACREGRLVIERAALQEAEDLEYDALGIENLLCELSVDDFAHRAPSTRYPGLDMWLFTPAIDDDLTLWIRMVERSGVMVFSFHDMHHDHEESP